MFLPTVRQSISTAAWKTVMAALDTAAACTGAPESLLKAQRTRVLTATDPALVLRLLEAATLRGVGHAPLVLLDDPFAELDARRAARILELLVGSGGAHQTILAVSRAADIPSGMTSLPRFRVMDGEVSAGSLPDEPLDGPAMSRPR